MKEVPVRCLKGGARAACLALALLAAAACLAGCRRTEVQSGQSSARSDVSKVTVAQVKEWMESGQPLMILDSRSGHAWEEGTTKARGALRVPPDDVEPHLSEIPRNERILVYCT
jgi:hypothetical protein